jgi:hypothetical protein
MFDGQDRLAGKRELRDCPACGCPAEGPGDPHVVLHPILSKQLLAGNPGRPVICMQHDSIAEQARPCGFLALEGSDGRG